MRFFLILLFCAAPASAQLELGRAYGNLSRVVAGGLAQAPAKKPKRRIFPLALAPVAPDRSAPLLFDSPLAQMRDRPLSAVTASAGGRTWSLGVVTDADYDEFFLVLRDGADVVVAPLAPVGRFLEDGGVTVSDEDGPLLRLNARVSLLHPINGTSIVAVDVDDGSKDSFTVGELVASLKALGGTFSAGGQDFSVFVLPEAGADGRSLSGERSIYLARIAGMRSRAWAVRESALEPGRPYRVVVSERALVLLKTVDGRLLVRDAGPAPR